MRPEPRPPSPSGPRACPQSGLHLIELGAGAEPPGRAREIRLALRAAVDARLAAWGWRWMRLPGGGRVCALPDAAPCPPISVSYGGGTAAILVSGDWRPVGVDIEVMSPRRAARLAARLEELGFEPGEDDAEHDAVAAFVRAEAWAKADGAGFAFGPSAALWRLRRSREPGLRPDGRLVLDVAPPALARSAEGPERCSRMAICQDMHAESPAVHVYSVDRGEAAVATERRA